MTTDKLCHGFRAVECEDLPHLKTKAEVWQHEKSGAKLFFMNNEDENKVFGIGFRTPSEDSTGVAHIVEHSVLSGSRKYKTKEPFMDLVASSLQTFLNAMTFSDKTIYPVASRNEKDFYHLVDVYLDGVFYPAIYENPKIFQQEGWHLELLDDDGPLDYRGVVYNEMRGATSLPESQVSHTIDEHLHPETSYRFESGGNPYEIPNLTEEMFLDFHRKYYHPSNSYIFLYGDIDRDKMFRYLDDEYLSDFDREDIDSALDFEPAFDEKKKLETVYPMAKHEDPEGKSFLTYSFIAGENKDMLLNFTRYIMGEVLINSESAPIRNALMDADIGEDIYVSRGTNRTLDFSIVAKNAKADQFDEFEEIIERELQKLVTEGIDRNLLLSNIRKLAFMLKEADDFPTKGVIYFISAMETWLYDGSPIDGFYFNKLIEQLEEGVDNGYFENWIEKYILNNPHRLVMAVHPEPGLTEKRETALRESLAEKKAAMSDEERQQLIEKTRELIEFQMAEDTPEAKATIPTLELSDISTEIPNFPLEVETFRDRPLFIAERETQGIIYAQWLFDLTVLEADELCYLGLLADLLGLLDTTRDYATLQNDIYLYTGGISINTTTVKSHSDKNEYVPYLSIAGKSFRDGFGKMMELMADILFETKWNQKKRIQQLVANTYSQESVRFVPQGHSVAIGRTRSYFTDGDRFDEMISGIDYFLFLSKVFKGELDLDEVVDKVQEVGDKLFKRGHVAFHVIAPKALRNTWEDQLDLFFDAIPEGELDKALLHFNTKPENEGWILPGTVQYVSAGNYILDFTYGGDWAVLCQLLRDDFLHNRIRARGGAYGSGITVDRLGLMTTYSYRDPHLRQTLDTYAAIGDYLRTLQISDEDLKKYIIGTTNQFNPPLTAYGSGMVALSRHFSGLTQEEVEKNLEEVLRTDFEQLKSKADQMSAALKDAKHCVLGSDEAIKKNREIFSSVEKLS